MININSMPGVSTKYFKFFSRAKIAILRSTKLHNFYFSKKNNMCFQIRNNETFNFMVFYKMMFQKVV